MKTKYTESRIKKIHAFIDKLFDSTDHIAFTAFADPKASKKNARPIAIVG